MSKLIVNADDFWPLHSAVNAGIIDGHRRGIITSYLFNGWEEKLLQKP